MSVVRELTYRPLTDERVIEVVEAIGVAGDEIVLSLPNVPTAFWLRHAVEDSVKALEAVFTHVAAVALEAHTVRPAEVTIVDDGERPVTITAGSACLLTFADPAAALQWLQDACALVVAKW